MAIKIPGYKLIRTLGKGGMATVFLAEQEIFEREVALKVMSRVLAEDPAFGQRFFREAKIVSQLVHPNIVTVHDVGMHDGYYYLSMEYIDGKDLKHARKDFPLRKKVRTIRDIAKALEYAGSKGYVHRDIKPENIMFHTSDGRAVLMDFGIARAAETDSSVTQTGIAIGTPHYMSPEQAKGKTVDHRSDIYSLGVVFYLLLAGRVPYDAESAVAIGIKHITEDVPSLPRGLEGLQAILDKMMAKRLSQRYASAKELIDDLDRLDIDLLEHAQEIAQHSAMASDSDDTLISGEEYVIDSNQDSSNSEQFTLMYDTQVDLGEPPRTGVVSTSIGIIFAIFAAAAAFYVFKPEIAQPWLSKAKAVSQEVYFELQQTVEELVPGIQKTDDNDSAADLASDAVVKDKNVTDKDVNEKREKTITETAPENSDSSLHNEETVLGDPPPLDDLNNGVAIAEPSGQTFIDGSSPSDSFEPQVVEADLKSSIASLSDSADSDPASLAQLVEKYREGVSLFPENNFFIDGFSSLKQIELNKAMALAKNGKASAVEKKLTQLQALFPEISEQERSSVEEALAETQRVDRLLDDAQRFVARNALTQPSKQNALARYREVLLIQPGNSQAKEGLAKISTTLVNLAEDKFKQGNLNAALNFSNKALDVDKSNAQASTLKQQVIEIQSKQKRIATLLADADRKIARKKLFSPDGAAYQDYIDVLALEPQNKKAKEGVDRVIDMLSSEVWKLVGAEQFLQAKQMLDEPIKKLPGSARVQALAQAVDEVIGEKILALQPRIFQLLAAGEPIDEIAGSSRASFSADRSVYLGFRYEHFQLATSVVQAVLMDGAKSLEISQVPVVLEGTQGTYSFAIDRPVEGFPTGSYVVEMRLDGNVLASISFSVN